jgi:hypothetical protein
MDCAHDAVTLEATLTAASLPQLSKSELAAHVLDALVEDYERVTKNGLSDEEATKLLTTRREQFEQLADQARVVEKDLFLLKLNNVFIALFERALRKGRFEYADLPMRLRELVIAGGLDLT